ncbi:hypothetical protein D8674_037628 [Pyrus ussuriensis x Pyrus communis]|uniref:Uncharacterized protein n=1 Tax=Pyrus ussuriensis x Pyrus communis TaxID=2448454 RepID=A0A5N5H1E3_9ROSA|nr:hypothetical protein D8674_037628 [Pyrus ussuriensis x Pyrus communis]
MLTTITKPIDDLLKLRDPCIKSLNGMAIRVLMEGDVRLPLKRVFIVNGDKELPTFLSYEGLFKVFGDEPNMLSEDFDDLNLLYATLIMTSSMGADDSERTISWASRKRRREHEGDSEDDSEGKGEVKGASAGNGMGANN